LKETIMAHPLRFGIMVLQNLPYPELVEHYQYIETLGFDNAWVADHFVDPYVPDKPWFDAWTILAALAARTSKIQLGAMVTNIIYRNPAVFAKQVLTIDHISNGRVNVAIGATSGRDLSHTMTGIPVWETPERVRRFREFTEIVDQMLRNPTTTYVGKYYQIKDATMSPNPIQQPRPPLTLAAAGPATLKVAAESADTWNSFGKFNASSEEGLAITHERGQMLDEYCAKIGRDPQTIRRSFLAGMTADKPFASMQAFHDFVGRYQEIGISEFIFYWLAEEGHPVMVEKGLNGGCITSRDILERIATEAIPAMMAKGTG
jgi:alkanesulfonate monooxygenase SsuD/methylene tetrahydromethanopterin reductase-like flavin-dependent oxidoreductase (luciferase family)